MAVLSLIGMSGVGKTYWSKQLAEQGWERICCDDLIEQQLQAICGTTDKGIRGVAEWLGQPTDMGYQDRQQAYLAAEIAVMQDILNHRLSANAAHPQVIDTTGSVVYTGERICQQLQRYSRVVYIALADQAIRNMIQRYLTDPKPVLWMDQFVVSDGIALCYPRLVAQRAALYQRYSHVILPYEHTSQPQFSLSDFLHAAL